MATGDELEFVVGGKIVKFTDEETLQVSKQKADPLDGDDELHFVNGTYYELSYNHGGGALGLTETITCTRLTSEQVLEWLEGFRIGNSKDRNAVAEILENLKDDELI